MTLSPQHQPFADAIMDSYMLWMDAKNPAATRVAELCLTARLRPLSLDESTELVVIAFCAGFGSAKVDTEECDARELLSDFEGRPQ